MLDAGQREKVVLDCLYQREERGKDDRRPPPALTSAIVVPVDDAATYSATAAQSVVGGRRGRGDGRHHVDLWRTLFWRVLATYTRRSGHGTFVLMDQTERF